MILLKNFNLYLKILLFILENSSKGANSIILNKERITNKSSIIKIFDIIIIGWSSSGVIDSLRIDSNIIKYLEISRFDIFIKKIL